MYLGVDCGTQSTKVVVVNPDTLQTLGIGSGGHDMISGDHGRREQQPQWWVDAFQTAFAEAIRNAGVSPRSIRAIGVSGQQHSMVAIDADGEPVYPAKLWCDTETAEQSAALINQMGGANACLDTIGVVPQPALTAPKIAWLREHSPEAYQRIATVLLPHDYLNFYLTGRRTAEASDASGTGYFDTRRRVWHEPAFTAAAPDLDPESVLPQLLEPLDPVGVVRKEIAEQLGLADDVIVSAGGGDNAMAAIGIGNINAGQIAMSLGTSGTLFGYSGQPVVTTDGLINNFCAAQGGWLPLVCTLNVTSVTSQLRTILGMETGTFEENIANAPPGAEGITMLPFFNGERVPDLPNATGSFTGLSDHNFTADNLCRAAVEGVTFGLRYGLDLFRDNDMEANEIRLVGGGAKSPVWRQIVADIMGAAVVYPQVAEAAAFGGALQAQWCHRNAQGDSVTLESLCAAAFESASNDTRCEPDAANIKRYDEVYARYRTALSEQYRV